MKCLWSVIKTSSIIQFTFSSERNFYWLLIVKVVRSCSADISMNYIGTWESCVWIIPKLDLLHISVVNMQLFLNLRSRHIMSVHNFIHPVMLTREVKESLIPPCSCIYLSAIGLFSPGLGKNFCPSWGLSLIKAWCNGHFSVAIHRSHRSHLVTHSNSVSQIFLQPSKEHDTSKSKILAVNNSFIIHDIVTFPILVF